MAESKRTVHVPKAQPGTREYKRELARLEQQEKKRVEALLASKIGVEVKLADFLDGGKGPGRRRRVRKLKLRRKQELPAREAARDIGSSH